MRALVFCVLASMSLAVSAEETAQDQQDPLEQKLQKIEFRTQHLVSGKEKFLKGVAQVKPALRKMACQAYSSKTNQATLDIVKKEIAELEQNASQLNADQATRLATQKQIASEFDPNVDCSAL